MLSVSKGRASMHPVNGYCRVSRSLAFAYPSSAVPVHLLAQTRPPTFSLSQARFHCAAHMAFPWRAWSSSSTQDSGRLTTACELKPKLSLHSDHGPYLFPAWSLLHPPPHPPTPAGSSLSISALTSCLSPLHFPILVCDGSTTWMDTSNPAVSQPGSNIPPAAGSLSPPPGHSRPPPLSPTLGAPPTVLHCVTWSVHYPPGLCALQKADTLLVICVSTTSAPAPLQLPSTNPQCLFVNRIVNK